MATRKINLLFIIDYFHRTGGTETHLVQLVRGLPRDLFNCHIIVFDLGENRLLDQARADGISVAHVPVAQEYTPNALVRAYQLARLIRQWRIDIVQTYHQKSDTYGALVARLAGVRHIISSRRDVAHHKKPRHFFMNRRVASLFEKVIVVSDAVADIVVSREGSDRQRIQKIYNGVDTVRFTPASEKDVRDSRAMLGIGMGDFVVGMVAGFRPEKNYDVFFEGARMALEKIPSLILVAVGGGPLLDQFRRTYAGSPIGQRTIFAGDVVDVSPYLKALDVGCLISQHEGFSNAVIEGMATGLPMVVTPVGGNAEAVLNGGNGLHVAPGDPSAFCSALVELYADSAKRREMGRRSRDAVESRFMLDHMCRNHAALYMSLLRVQPPSAQCGLT